MLVCEEINFELPPKIIVLNPKDGFRIVRVDGGCVDHQIRCVIQVGSTLTVVENGSFGFQLLCEVGLVGIGAGYFEMLVQ